MTRLAFNCVYVIICNFSHFVDQCVFRMDTSGSHQIARLCILQLLVEDKVHGLIDLLLEDNQKARIILEALLDNKRCNW